MSDEHPPNKIYVEVWPEECDRDDIIHYERTGYGIDMDGNASEIIVYSREGNDPDPTSDDLDRLRADLAEARDVIAELVPYANGTRLVIAARLREVLEWAEAVLEKGGG